ncbi:hypothetical protein Sjap_018586 [Stephania japonica]|uniref:Uncharacterized protein n=1 Tax=Stephania japonica TaxID=461633 RepID=A0AAP0I882_9MAGN
MQAGVSKTPVQRCSAKDTVATPSVFQLTVSPTYVFGRNPRGTRREDAAMTNEVTTSLTYELGSKSNLHAMETPSRLLYATASRRRVTVHKVNFYESFGNFQAYLDPQSNKGKAPELRDLL